MEFIKSLIKNRRLAFQLGKNDFKNRFAGTSFGAFWGFVQPFIFMMTYVIVFQFILKAESTRKLSVYCMVFTWNGYVDVFK